MIIGGLVLLIIGQVTHNCGLVQKLESGLSLGGYVLFEFYL